MKTSATALGMLSPILYFVAGVFWLGIVVVGGGFLLIWAALACFITGIFLVAWSSSWVVRPLAKASAVFGLALTVYQLYVGLTLVGTGLDPVAEITSGLFGVMTAIYLYLLLFGRAAKKEA